MRNNGGSGCFGCPLNLHMTEVCPLIIWSSCLHLPSLDHQLSMFTFELGYRYTCMYLFIYNNCVQLLLSYHNFVPKKYAHLDMT